MCKTKRRVIRLAGELGSLDDLQIQLLSSNLNNIDARAQAHTKKSVRQKDNESAWAPKETLS